MQHSVFLHINTEFFFHTYHTVVCHVPAHKRIPHLKCYVCVYFTNRFLVQSVTIQFYKSAVPQLFATSKETYQRRKTSWPSMISCDRARSTLCRKKCGWTLTIFACSTSKWNRNTSFALLLCVWVVVNVCCALSMCVWWDLWVYTSIAVSCVDFAAL